jgi:hypothetical protein
VATHLAQNRWYRERSERVAAVGIEPLKGFEQPERSNLDQIVERLGRAAVAPRQASRQRHEPVDQGVPGRLVGVALPAQDKLGRIVGPDKGLGAQTGLGWVS